MVLPQAEILHERVEAVLTEYRALRGEIDRRSRYQLLVLTGSLASVSVVLGIVFKNPSESAVLVLVIPWILSVFGITWLDHAHGIHIVGQYIRDEIESKKLPHLLDSEKGDAIGWETYIAISP